MVLANLYGRVALLGKVVAAILLLAGGARAETVHLVALGDSLTQGFGLLEEEGFVPQMRGWLERQGADVRLVNAGVSGDTTAGGLARVAWSLTPEIQAMIVTLGGNDMLRGIAPEVARANLAGILEEARGRDVAVLLVGMRAPGNYGPEYKAAFDGMYAALAEEYGALLHEDFFSGLGVSDPVDAQPFMQPDGTHPNGDGVRRIVEAIGPDVLRLIERVGQ